MLVFFPPLVLYVYWALAAITGIHSIPDSPPEPDAQSNPNPTVPGNSVDGWQEFPTVIDATGYPRWVVEERRRENITMVWYTAQVDV